MNEATIYALQILRPALLLAPATAVDDIAAWLARSGVQQAVADHDTASIFDWILPLLGLQGISDAAAGRFAARHAPVTWRQVEEALRSTPPCPRLRSYWHYHRCGYRKGTTTCAEADRYANCFVPALPLRKGVLNEAAVSLHLFLRDVCDGDFVGWLDMRLAAADQGLEMPDRGRVLAAAVVEPLCHVAGTGPKLWSMILADLLLAGDLDRERWVTAGASMIVIDSLVHAYLHRTGILRRFDAEHAYGPTCYAAGGCAAIIEALADHIDAREFNRAFPACFPRFVPKAIWHFCTENGLDICNGRRIDDQQRCGQVFCPSFPFCERIALRPAGSPT